MLEMIKHEKQVDIYNYIYKIRSQRNLLVQSIVSKITYVVCMVGKALGEGGHFHVFWVRILLLAIVEMINHGKQVKRGQ